VEGLGIANSGFAGKEPELTLPQELVRELFGEGPKMVLMERMLADGTEHCSQNSRSLSMFM
jgi:hypothetical protein